MKKQKEAPFTSFEEDPIEAPAAPAPSVSTTQNSNDGSTASASDPMVHSRVATSAQSSFGSGVEQVLGDDPPVPFDPSHISCEEGEYIKNEGKGQSEPRLADRGIEQIDNNEGAPIPLDQVLDLHEGIDSEEGLKTKELKTGLEVDENDEPPMPLDQTGLLEKKSALIDEPVRNNSNSLNHVSNQQTNMQVSLANRPQPETSEQQQQQPFVNQTPSFSSQVPVLQATLVPPEPPIYNAEILPESVRSETVDTPSDIQNPWWKKHLFLLVGGLLLLIIVMAATIGALVSTQINSSGNNEEGISEGNGGRPSEFLSGTAAPSPALENANADSNVAPTNPPPVVTSSPSSMPSSMPSNLANLHVWGYKNAFGVDNVDSYWNSPVLTNYEVMDASAGQDYSIILLQDGTAYSAGFVRDLNQDYYCGRLGRTNCTEYTNSFQRISKVFDAATETSIDAPPFQKVFAASSHSLLIDAYGNAWATGDNYLGKLCLGDKEHREIPNRISIGCQVVDAAINALHTLLLCSDGTVYGCGSNNLGLLGLGDVFDVNIPTKIEGLDYFVESVSAGESYSLFLTTHSLMVTGWDETALCVEKVGQTKTPFRIWDINRLDVVSFQASSSSTFILFQNGTAVACGSNHEGQLGDGTDVDKLRTTVSMPTPVKKVFVGPTAVSSFFVGDDGIIYATGSNFMSQLGVGGDWERGYLVPTAIDFDENIELQHLSASSSHTLAITNLISTKKAVSSERAA